MTAPTRPRFIAGLPDYNCSICRRPVSVLVSPGMPSTNRTTVNSSHTSTTQSTIRAHIGSARQFEDIRRPAFVGVAGLPTLRPPVADWKARGTAPVSGVLIPDAFRLGDYSST
jgi:hypothetical protein